MCGMRGTRAVLPQRPIHLRRRRPTQTHALPLENQGGNGYFTCKKRDGRRKREGEADSQSAPLSMFLGNDVHNLLWETSSTPRHRHPVPPILPPPINNSKLKNKGKTKDTITPPSACCVPHHPLPPQPPPLTAQRAAAAARAGRVSGRARGRRGARAGIWWRSGRRRPVFFCVVGLGIGVVCFCMVACVFASIYMSVYVRTSM